MAGIVLYIVDFQLIEPSLDADGDEPAGDVDRKQISAYAGVLVSDRNSSGAFQS